MKAIIKEGQTQGGFSGTQYSIEVRLELTPEQLSLVNQYKALDIEIPITPQITRKIRHFISGFKLTERSISVYSSLRIDCTQACQKVKTLMEIYEAFGTEQVIDLG